MGTRQPDMSDSELSFESESESEDIGFTELTFNNGDYNNINRSFKKLNTESLISVKDEQNDEDNNQSQIEKEFKQINDNNEKYLNESDSDDDWKEINTQLDCGDIYNLKGEKLDSFVHTNNFDGESEHDLHNNSTLRKTSAKMGQATLKTLTGVNLGSNKKHEQLQQKYSEAHLSNNSQQGYTRIDIEEQAKKFKEMDKKFDFLFQNDNSNLRKLHHAQSDTSLPTSTDIENNNQFIAPDKFNDVFANEGHNENELDPETQMMSTKNMLNEGQKIAYAALVKLIIVQLNTELAMIRGSGSTKILKKLANSQKSFIRWSMKVMNSLYDHLEINKIEERQMIESLSCHGVQTSDLTKSFKNITILNNLSETKNLQIINIPDSKDLKIDIKWTLICDLFLILLESSVYDARSRTLLLNFAKEINITPLEIYQFERRITDSLEIDETMEHMQHQQIDEKDLVKEHKKKSKNAKIVKIALATAAGGLVIGLSAGALAPVIGAGLAAGLTTVGIGGTSGFLAGAGGTAIITTGGVLSGMRAGQSAMSNRAGNVKTFQFIPLHNNKRVNLTITVSGWMSGELDDVRLPFSTVDQVMGDLYSLLWEPEMLTSMGQTIGILANEVLTQSIQQVLGSTLLIGLMSGLQLPMMLSKLGYLLDNPWNVSLDRAQLAGDILANTLRRKNLGVRPITLVGFSLGARLIYSCLLSLAKSGDYGIVENVFIFGSPIVVKSDEMAMARSVVSGRFVNGYQKQDWILGYLFRATSGGLRTIAGLAPIEVDSTEDGLIENFDCSEYVKGHMMYRESMPRLLRLVGWEVLGDEFVEIERPDGEKDRNRKLMGDLDLARKKGKKKGRWWWGKKEWWEMYEEGEKDREKREKDEIFNVEGLKKEIEKIEDAVKNDNLDKKNDSTHEKKKKKGKGKEKGKEKTKGKGKNNDEEKQKQKQKQEDKDDARIDKQNKVENDDALITGDTNLNDKTDDHNSFKLNSDLHIDASIGFTENSNAQPNAREDILEQPATINTEDSAPYTPELEGLHTFHISPTSNRTTPTAPKRIRPQRSLINLQTQPLPKQRINASPQKDETDGLKPLRLTSGKGKISSSESKTRKSSAIGLNFLNVVPNIESKHPKNNEPIDYGDDDLQLGVESITFDTDFDEIDRRVREKTERIDYGDDDAAIIGDSSVRINFS